MARSRRRSRILQKVSPQKEAETVETNYEHIPSFLTKDAADELYGKILKQEWTIKDDGSAALTYGVSYDGAAHPY